VYTRTLNLANECATNTYGPFSPEATISVCNSFTTRSLVRGIGPGPLHPYPSFGERAEFLAPIAYGAIGLVRPPTNLMSSIAWWQPHTFEASILFRDGARSEWFSDRIRTQFCQDEGNPFRRSERASFTFRIADRIVHLPKSRPEPKSNAGPAPSGRTGHFSCSSFSISHPFHAI